MGVRVEHGLEEGDHVGGEPGRYGVGRLGNFLEQSRQAGLIKWEVACHDDIQQHSCSQQVC